MSEEHEGNEHMADGKDIDSGLMFYRCILCGQVVSVWDIRESHGCPKCKNNRLRPSELSLREKIVQIFKHPKIWAWHKEVL